MEKKEDTKLVETTETDIKEANKQAEQSQVTRSEPCSANLLAWRAINERLWNVAEILIREREDAALWMMGGFLIKATEKDASIEFLQMLLENGCDINETDERGRNALCIAIMYDVPVETIRFLLDRGSDLENVTAVSSYCTIWYIIGV